MGGGKNSGKACHGAAVVVHGLHSGLHGVAGGDGSGQNEHMLALDHGGQIVTQDDLAAGGVLRGNDVDGLVGVQFECFEHPVALQHDLLAPAAADQFHIQLGSQFAGGRFPSLVQLAVVDQGNQQLAAQGGEKIDLEQPAAQGVVGYQAAQSRLEPWP
jgi:hypothetical protein